MNPTEYRRIRTQTLARLDGLDILATVATAFAPRPLFIPGREAEAERIVDQIEAQVVRETGQALAETAAGITVRQRAAIPLRGESLLHRQ